MLIKEGFQCYLVGGALRDIVMDIEPDDYDLATDAQPEEMLKIYPKAVSVGAKFGTIYVIVPGKKGMRHEVQITTFRSEEQYVGGRWPAKVEFVKKIDKDLARRDFTFNAMALDLGSGELDGKNVEKEWEVYDPFGGRKDMSKKLVRAVGDPVERFKEDGLRPFRACRLAAQLDFEIESETKKAITETLSIAAQVSAERIRDEFKKMLKNAEKPSKGIELMRETGLLKLFMPELIEGVGKEQKLFHAHDVYEHALACMDVAPVDIRLAALFHDIGKPRKAMPDGHFYGHDKESAKMARKIMKRLKFSKDEIEETANLVRHHMFYYPIPGEDATKEEIEKYEEKRWTDAAVRRFIARVGEENIDNLFELRIADATCNPKSAFRPEEIELLQKRISEVREKDMALKVSDLKISGHDLAELGIEKGPEMGDILRKLLDKVIDDPSLNEKKKLEELAKEMAE